MYEENRRFLEEKSFSVHPPFNKEKELAIVELEKKLTPHILARKNLIS